jgi:prevent-host-death family protein
VNTIGAFEAKTHFSDLLKRAHEGEEIVITRRGEPFAKLGPIEPKHDVDKALDAMRQIRERAREIGIDATPEEIKEWINEGRRY